MTARNEQVAEELLGVVAMALGVDQGFMVRDVIDACKHSEVLRRYLVRAGLVNHIRLGHVLAGLEGRSFAGMRLWREWSSRRGHRYSLRRAG